MDIESTMQDKYSIRSYLVNVVKALMEKNQKRDRFTLWENANTHNPSIYGIYLSYLDSYTKYKTGGGQNKYTISFLKYDEFPNCIFGQFSLTIPVTPEASVWCCCDPPTSIKQQSHTKLPNVSLGDSVLPVQWVDTNHLKHYFYQFICKVPDNLITSDIQDVYYKRLIQQKHQIEHVQIF
jgi:hypothetical protein